jgi:hypothetical protein
MDFNHVTMSELNVDRTCHWAFVTSLIGMKSSGCHVISGEYEDGPAIGADRSDVRTAHDHSINMEK